MSRLERIALVLIDHSYDYETGECFCGFRPYAGGIEVHVAEQIEAVL